MTAKRITEKLLLVSLSFRLSCCLETLGTQQTCHNEGSELNKKHNSLIMLTTAPIHSQYVTLSHRACYANSTYLRTASLK